MTIGAITWRTPSSQTAPSGLPAFLGSAEADAVYSRAPSHGVFAPDIFGIVHGNGVGQQIHDWRGNTYWTGILPPVAAPTVSVSSAGGAVRASATVTALAGTSAGVQHIHAGDSMTVTDGNTTITVNFVAALTGGNAYEVVVGADDAATVGVVYYLWGTWTIGRNITWQYPNGATGGPVPSLATDITVTTSGEVITLRAKTYGSVGNGYSVSWTSGTGPDPTVNNFSGGQNVSGSMAAGTYRWAYTYLRSGDGAESALSPYLEATVGDNDGMILANLVSSVDGDVDLVRIYRTTKDGEKFYRIAEQDDATATYTDTEPDVNIVADGALYYNERLYRSRRAGYPVHHSYYAFHNGAVFGAGARLRARYAVGTAVVYGPDASSGASATVTFSTAVPDPTWIGRTFKLYGEEDETRYVIVAVSNGVNITLDRVFEGATNATAGYEVLDERDPHVIDYAVVGKINQWPGQQSIEGVTSKDGRGVTGLRSKWERLVVFTYDSVWLLVGDAPGSYILRRAVAGVGCVNGRTVVEDGDLLYWLDQEGIYVWDGSSNPLRISNPQGADRQGIQGTIDRINLAHENWCHGVKDPEGRVIKWFVPLDDDVVPRAAIVLDLATRTFSTEDVPDVTSAAVVTRPDGDRVLVYGDLAGNFWHTENGATDGAYDFVALQTLSGTQTDKVLTTSGTALPTSGSGLAGVPVLLKDAAGNWEIQEVASNTNAAITLRRETSLTLAAGDQIMFGGIMLDVGSGFFDLGISDVDKIISRVILTHIPDSTGQYFIGFGVNGGSLSQPTLDASYSALLSDSTGKTVIRANRRGTTHAFRIVCPDLGCRPTFRRISFDIRARDQIRVQA